MNRLDLVNRSLDRAQSTLESAIHDLTVVRALLKLEPVTAEPTRPALKPKAAKAAAKTVTAVAALATPSRGRYVRTLAQRRRMSQSQRARYARIRAAKAKAAKGVTSHDHAAD